MQQTVQQQLIARLGSTELNKKTAEPWAHPITSVALVRAGRNQRQGSMELTA